MSAAVVLVSSTVSAQVKQDEQIHLHHHRLKNLKKKWKIKMLNCARNVTKLKGKLECKTGRI